MATLYIFKNMSIDSLDIMHTIMQGHVYSLSRHFHHFLFSVFGTDIQYYSNIVSRNLKSFLAALETSLNEV